MSERARRTLRISRDTLIVVIGLGLGIYEVLGEGRPAVLAFIGSLFISPLVMRADEARRERDPANGRNGRQAD